MKNLKVTLIDPLYNELPLFNNVFSEVFADESYIMVTLFIFALAPKHQAIKYSYI